MSFLCWEETPDAAPWVKVAPAVPCFRDVSLVFSRLEGPNDHYCDAAWAAQPSDHAQPGCDGGCAAPARRAADADAGPSGNPRRLLPRESVCCDQRQLTGRNGCSGESVLGPDISPGLEPCSFAEAVQRGALRGGGWRTRVIFTSVSSKVVSSRDCTRCPAGTAPRESPSSS